MKECIIGMIALLLCTLSMIAFAFIKKGRTIRSKIYMKDILKELEDIAEKFDTINTQMNDEARVWAEELADRKRQGLTGDAAIKHYNDWMDLHGMRHLQG